MSRTQVVEIPQDDAGVQGELTLAESSRAVVVFAHGSGSSRHSPRNRQVAEQLQRGGLGTLLVDLLTESEEAIDLRTAQLRFDVHLLADRLVGAVAWLDAREAGWARPWLFRGEHRCRRSPEGGGSARGPYRRHCLAGRTA